MNTHVDFETAKLLKEKCFDENTDSYYCYSPDQTFDLLYEKLKNSDHANNEVSAPTIMEVVMWFYKEHDLWISANFYKTFEEKILWSYTIKNITKSYNETLTIGKFNSMNEAYLKAINYCLTKLI